ITDNSGASLTKTYKIRAKYITEHFNGAAVPAVEKLKGFLFWDPFSATGLYDPIIYADVKKVPISGWDPSIDDRFTLLEWLVEEGEVVDQGQEIALIHSENNGNMRIRANASGKLSHLAE